MQISFKNIGIIKEADINLDGLTVIAGLNDSGKSTIGKSIFSVIKSVSRYKEDLEEDKETNIKKLVDGIYFFLRRKISFSDDIRLKDMFYPINFYNDIVNHQVDAVYSRFEYIKYLDEKIKDNLAQRLEKLVELISQSDNKKDAIKRAFKKIFYSEFEYEILNKHKKNQELSSIKIKEFENEILNIELTSFSDINLEIYDELYFNDCTIIETPLVLNYSDAIEQAKSYFEIKTKKDKLGFLGIANISFHTKDLDLKLKESSYNDEDELSKRILEVIDGNIKYEPSKSEFMYTKENGLKYKIINTASGIKSFGVLQMLSQSGFLDERSLIVIDEPEVHLHPYWQLKYAEILVCLVQKDVNILITTHSPYILQAIKFYSDKVSDVKGRTNIYLSEKLKNNEEVVITDKTDDLNSIFEKLSKPLQDIVWN